MYRRTQEGRGPVGNEGAMARQCEEEKMEPLAAFAFDKERERCKMVGRRGCGKGGGKKNPRKGGGKERCACGETKSTGCVQKKGKKVKNGSKKKKDDCSIAVHWEGQKGGGHNFH